MADWQPIETAPRDGTCVLLFVPGEQSQGQWDEELYDGCGGEPEAPILVGFWDKDHGRPGPWWQLAHYSAYCFKPTHWMPLPEPPASQSSGAA